MTDELWQKGKLLYSRLLADSAPSIRKIEPARSMPICFAILPPNTAVRHWGRGTTSWMAVLA